MDKSDFIKAGMEVGHRQKLLAELRADPVLRKAAIARVAQINDHHTRGQIRDRCHITNMEHQALTRLLAQIEAEKAE